MMLDQTMNAMAPRLARAREAGLRRLSALGRFDLDDRRKGADRLVVILAGFKQFLWPATLARMARLMPNDLDVCLVSAGLRLPELEQLAAAQGWSYLTTATRFMTTAQNIAIGVHPQARYIYKLDEDIILPEGYFDALLDRYGRVERESAVRPGFIAPLMNVNGFSYVDFVRFNGMEEEFTSRFGALVRAGGDLPAQSDGAVARWLWERTLPFDQMAKRFAGRPFGYSTVPFKFSIGAILFERILWERMSGFRRGWVAPGLGVDEARICLACVSLSRVMTVADDIFAGHFAFGPQVAVMKKMYHVDPGRFL
jgi:hypothetical protein